MEKRSFIAEGFLSLKNDRNRVEVEGNLYWISTQDCLRVAEGLQLNPSDENTRGHLDGEKVRVQVTRESNGKCWAKLVNQRYWCPVNY